MTCRQLRFEMRDEFYLRVPFYLTDDDILAGFNNDKTDFRLDTPLWNHITHIRHLHLDLSHDSTDEFTVRETKALERVICRIKRLSSITIVINEQKHFDNLVAARMNEESQGRLEVLRARLQWHLRRKSLDLPEAQRWMKQDLVDTIRRLRTANGSGIAGHKFHHYGGMYVFAITFFYQQFFPFLEFPRSIRERIYHHVLHPTHNSSSSRIEKDPGDIAIMETNLPWVCQQVYHEVCHRIHEEPGRPLWEARIPGTFHVSVSALNPSLMVDQKIYEHDELIHRLYVHVEGSYLETGTLLQLYKLLRSTLSLPTLEVLVVEFKLSRSRDRFNSMWFDEAIKGVRDLAQSPRLRAFQIDRNHASGNYFVGFRIGQKTMLDELPTHVQMRICRHALQGDVFQATLLPSGPRIQVDYRVMPTLSLMHTSKQISNFLEKIYFTVTPLHLVAEIRGWRPRLQHNPGSKWQLWSRLLDCASQLEVDMIVEESPRNERWHTLKAGSCLRRLFDTFHASESMRRFHFRINPEKPLALPSLWPLWDQGWPTLKEVIGDGSLDAISWEDWAISEMRDGQLNEVVLTRRTRPIDQQS